MIEPEEYENEPEEYKSERREVLIIIVAIGLCVLSLFSCGAVLILHFHDQQRFDAVAATTHNALCTLKADLQRRVDDTELYIVQIQRGERRPIQGITIADLERSVSGQKSSLRALSSLVCTH